MNRLNPDSRNLRCSPMPPTCQAMPRGSFLPAHGRASCDPSCPALQDGHGRTVTDVERLAMFLCIDELSFGRHTLLLVADTVCDSLVVYRFDLGQRPLLPCKRALLALLSLECLHSVIRVRPTGS